MIRLNSHMLIKIDFQIDMLLTAYESFIDGRLSTAILIY
jgi:hypothetical protein